MSGFRSVLAHAVLCTDVYLYVSMLAFSISKKFSAQSQAVRSTDNCREAKWKPETRLKINAKPEDALSFSRPCMERLKPKIPCCAGEEAAGQAASNRASPTWAFAPSRGLKFSEFVGHQNTTETFCASKPNGERICWGGNFFIYLFIPWWDTSLESAQ